MGDERPLKERTAEGMRKTRQLLIIELIELDGGAKNVQQLANAIEDYVLAAISHAFATHPVTKPAGSGG